MSSPKLVAHEPNDSGSKLPHCVVSLAFAYLVCRNLISESLSELDSKTLGTLGQNHP